MIGGPTLRCRQNRPSPFIITLSLGLPGPLPRHSRQHSFDPARVLHPQHPLREWSRGSKEFDELKFDSDWARIVDQKFDLALLIRFAKSEEWGDKQCYDDWAGHVVLNKSLQQACLTTDFSDTDAAELLRLYLPPHLFDSHHPKVLKALYCFQLASGIYKHATSKSIKRDIKDGFRTCLNGVLKTHKQTWSALAEKFIDDEDSLDRHEKHSLIALGGLPKSDKDGVYYQPAQLSSDRSYMSNLRTYIGHLHGKSAINNVYEVFQASLKCLPLEMCSGYLNSL